MTPRRSPREPSAAVSRAGRGTHGWSVPGNEWDALDGLVPEEPVRVSVVVVHYDQARELARTLRALARQTLPALEVIVVDDGSPSPPHVPDGVRLILLPDRGFRAAAARNTGAAAASGDVLCFLDADTAPEPDYLARLSRLPALCPEAVTVGRRRHAAFGDTDAAAPHPASAEPVELAGPRVELPEPGWLRTAYAASRDLLDANQHSYRFMIGAVLACSRWFFGETGGFDERFDRYGGEDWEWAHRAWTQGAVFAHVPDAVAWHDGADLAGRAGDIDELRRRKNAEALVLFDRIGPRGTGSTQGGLRGGAVDVVAELPPGGVTATLVCADVLLQALPGVRIVVDDEVAAALHADGRIVASGRAADVRADARVTLAVQALFTVPRHGRGTFGATLGSAVDEVGVGTLGWIDVTALPGGAEPRADLSDPVLRISSRRAGKRRERHPDAHGFRTEHRALPLRILSGEPDLEAHLAGWGD